MMENWQFFLQKEGDYAWLPLETPQVEILEGRYQLIAHTTGSGATVQVNIRHQYEQDNIPQENIQDSVRSVEISGKVEILPWVYLGLGSWSIQCCVQPDGIDEAIDRHLAETDTVERYSLAIQVLSQDFDLFENWNFETPDSGSTSHPTDSIIPVEMELSDLQTHEAPVPVGLEAVTSVELSTSVEASVAINEVSVDEVSVDEVSVDDMADDILNHSVTSGSGSDSLLLPTFSADTPTIEFRTVSSKELPRLVSDRKALMAPASPELPSFTHSQSIAKTAQHQRLAALTKIQLIAAVSHQLPQRELSKRTCQQKFQSKLSKIAVNAMK